MVARVQPLLDALVGLEQGASIRTIGISDRTLLAQELIYDLMRAPKCKIKIDTERTYNRIV